MQLGQARRDLGHKTGVWDKQKNDKLVSQLGGDEKGGVLGYTFVEHFVGVLDSLTDSEFGDTVNQFKQVARVCREIKRSKGSIGGLHGPTDRARHASKDCYESKAPHHWQLVQQREADETSKHEAQMVAKVQGQLGKLASAAHIYSES